jgi:predicted PurR-regulated permease PerM
VRRGSVAIVPLFLAIALLFWFIWFFGNANDNLHKVNQIENLQHTQDRLLQAAIQKRYELEEANPTLSDKELDKTVDKYIKEMMKLNKIDKD